MKCPICNTDIPDKAMFCPSCGYKAEASMESAPETAPGNMSSAAEPASEPAAPPRDPFATQATGGTQSAGDKQSSFGSTQTSPKFFDDNLTPIVSVGNWLGAFLILMLVPLALSVLAGIVSDLVGASHIVAIILDIVAAASGLVIILIFAFSKRVNPSKRNMFRACLILTLIFIVLFVVLLIVLFTAFSSVVDQFSGMSDLQELRDLLHWWK